MRFITYVISWNERIEISLINLFNRQILRELGNKLLARIVDDVLHRRHVGNDSAKDSCKYLINKISDRMRKAWINLPIRVHLTW